MVHRTDRLSEIIYKMKQNKLEPKQIRFVYSSVNKEPNEVRQKIGFLTSELKLEDFFTPNYLFDFFIF